MATIRATCPACGDVRLQSTQLIVRVCSDDDSAAYRFRCPNCEDQVSKPASGRIVDLLVAAGVRMEVWQLPAEVREHHDGPPLDLDDLLDFHLLLRQDGWLESQIRAEWGCLPDEPVGG